MFRVPAEISPCSAWRSSLLFALRAAVRCRLQRHSRVRARRRAASPAPGPSHAHLSAAAAAGWGNAVRLTCRRPTGDSASRVRKRRCSSCKSALFERKVALFGGTKLPALYTRPSVRCSLQAEAVARAGCGDAPLAPRAELRIWRFRAAVDSPSANYLHQSTGENPWLMSHCVLHMFSPGNDLSSRRTRGSRVPRDVAVAAAIMDARVRGHDNR